MQSSHIEGQAGINPNRQAGQILYPQAFSISLYHHHFLAPPPSSCNSPQRNMKTNFRITLIAEELFGQTIARSFKDFTISQVLQEQIEYE